MTEETLPGPEVKPELQELLQTADGILRGKVSSTDDFDEDSFDPSEVLWGPIVDLNDETLTDQDRSYATSWIERTLERKITDALVKQKLTSSDGTTTIKIFDKKLGQGDDDYYLSEWQNTGEQQSYILWQEGMYENLIEEDDYKDITGESPQHS